MARELPVPGRELGGVHLAMDFLAQQNRRLAGDALDPRAAISAAGKRVVVIGGGDTGSDCVGTCHRQGAAVVHQLELLPRPPHTRAAETPWPYWPMQLRTSHAHEEGGARAWSVLTTALSGDDGQVQRLHATRAAMEAGPDGRPRFVPDDGAAFTIEADLVLLAMGFTGPDPTGLLDALGVRLGPGSTIATDAAYATNVPGVFAAGDARRGASLIVWAIREGQDAAAAIGQYLLRARAV